MLYCILQALAASEALFSAERERLAPYFGNGLERLSAADLDTLEQFHYKGLNRLRPLLVRAISITHACACTCSMWLHACASSWMYPYAEVGMQMLLCVAWDNSCALQGHIAVSLKGYNDGFRYVSCRRSTARRRMPPLRTSRRRRLRRLLWPPPWRRALRAAPAGARARRRRPRRPTPAAAARPPRCETRRWGFLSADFAMLKPFAV